MSKNRKVALQAARHASGLSLLRVMPFGADDTVVFLRCGVSRTVGGVSKIVGSSMGIIL